ncbi:cell division protein [Phenylobacterium sp.]|uniref:cell division protein FtsL n=1 Tax=Phenylobacterium sp. TaxID=1871053 RepID=UPI00122349A1|nr:cell division protein [Phenylobacterium sp.]THD61442.1 MAG: cell division protein [Phenylobacterium sp.]
MNWLNRRVRGFRLVDLVALGLLTMLILGVYLAKTVAGGERAKIAAVERQIVAEKARIRLLQAEVSHLEQPARIERLSETYLNLAPVSEKRVANLEDLPQLAQKPLAMPVKAVAPTPDPILIAPAQPASPLPVPTQVADLAGSKVTQQ